MVFLSLNTYMLNKALFVLQTSSYLCLGPWMNVNNSKNIGDDRH